MRVYFFLVAASDDSSVIDDVYPFVHRYGTSWISISCLIYSVWCVTSLIHYCVSICDDGGVWLFSCDGGGSDGDSSCKTLITGIFLSSIYIYYSEQSELLPSNLLLSESELIRIASCYVYDRSYVLSYISFIFHLTDDSVHFYVVFDHCTLSLPSFLYRYGLEITLALLFVFSMYPA